MGRLKGAPEARGPGSGAVRPGWPLGLFVVLLLLVAALTGLAGARSRTLPEITGPARLYVPRGQVWTGPHEPVWLDLSGPGPRSCSSQPIGPPCPRTAARGLQAPCLVTLTGRCPARRWLARGAGYRASARGATVLLGQPFPPTSPEVLMLGHALPVPSKLSMEHALVRARLYGGVGLLARPGVDDPAEPEAWASRVAGVTVFGDGGVDPDTYRALVSHRGGALLAAAVASPGGDRHTRVLAPYPDGPGLIDGILSRATVAMRGLDDLELRIPGLGRVHHQARARVSITLGRPVERIELWRETTLIRVYQDTARASFTEAIDEPVVYTFFIDDQEGSALGSGIWFDPRPIAARDLTVDPASLSWAEGRASAVVRNRGSTLVRFVKVQFFDGLPGSSGRKRLGWVELDRIAAGDALEVDVFTKASPKVLYVELASALEQGGWADATPWDDFAFLPLRGKLARLWASATAAEARGSSQPVAEATIVPVQSKDLP